MYALRLFPGISAVMALVCLSGLAQQPPAKPAPGQPAPAQPTAPAPQEPTIRFGTFVNEVIVPVTVTDDRGKFVSNLEAKDFRVLDEGKPQKLQFFSHNQKQPIVVGFLVDLSNNTKIHWKTFQEALEDLVYQLLPGDQRYSGYLIGYSSDAELMVNTTSDYNKIADKIRKIKPGGGAALFDAIYKACTTRDLVKGEPYEPRRIIIIVGDGHDNASKKGLAEVLELAQRNLVTVYAVSTQAYGFANSDRGVLEELTSKTGGHVETPLLNPYKDVAGFLSQPSDAGNYAITVGTGGYAAQISKSIMESTASLWSEITTQYVLRYQPDFDPEVSPKIARRIKVDVPSLPNVKVSSREVYYPNGIPVGPGGGR
jgi:Ca-activated chloride channel family protein